MIVEAPVFRREDGLDELSRDAREWHVSATLARGERGEERGFQRDPFDLLAVAARETA